MPIRFTPGNKSFATCQINCKSEQTKDRIQCACPQTINKKSLNSNADVDQTITQSRLAVNAIRYSVGGETQFGNSAETRRIQYLGRSEGQPGGIGRLSAKNRF